MAVVIHLIVSTREKHTILQQPSCLRLNFSCILFLDALRTNTCNPFQRMPLGVPGAFIPNHGRPVPHIIHWQGWTRPFQREVRTSNAATPVFYHMQSCCHDASIYLFCICCVSCALCSWKRSLTRCCVAIHFITQRLMQPFSRVDTALEVKSSTHDVKQCSTRPPKAFSSR